MRDLTVRLAALDADAGAALRVIAYFDQLTESRAGLQAIVRGAAVLAGCPARLDDDERRVHVRVTPDGDNVALAAAAGADWPRAAVGERATLALERDDGPGPIDDMILERAAGAARAVLDRTRGRAPAADPALVELIVDAAAPAAVREKAARGLGLAGPVRAVARSGTPVVLAAEAALPAGRTGVGPAGPVLDLPASWAAARIALRFAADGTAEDPGATVVHFDELGALTLLAAAPLPAEIPDEQALTHAIAAAPWSLATLHAVADTASLRAAAAALRVHHSTLQDRIVHLEHLLTWPVRTPEGKLRLQLALAVRRLRRHPA